MSDVLATAAQQLGSLMLPSLLLMLLATKLRRRAAKRVAPLASPRMRAAPAPAEAAPDAAPATPEPVDEPAQAHLMWAMSHELRTPLNGIIGLSESLLMGHFGGPLAQDAERVVSIIKASGSHLLQLVDDVLDAAALQKGAISMQLQCMELAPLVAQLVQAYSPLAKPGVALSSSVPPGTAVLADPNRLRQALSHVLDNACKFTLQGTIQVSAHAAPAAGSSSSSDADGSGADEVVTISVADTGVGIPAAQLPHVWKLFRQADMGPARQHCGAGLGLCLVRGLVEALGGKVEVVSKEGSGTSCHMRVPGWRAPVASSQAAAQQAQQGAPAGASASVEVSGLPVGSALEPRGLYHHAASSMRHSSSSNALAAMLASSAAATAAPSALGCGGDVPAASGLRSPKASSSGLGSLSKGTYREKHGRVQVLCVDDDAISQLVVKRLLGPSGYHIVQVMSGHDALAFLEASDCFPDVILLDVMMPGLSGTDTCRAIRKRYPEMAIPIIMLSANNNVEHISSGLSAGSNDYMTKPFNHQELLARIKAQLNLSTLHRAQLHSWLELIMAGGHTVNLNQQQQQQQQQEQLVGSPGHPLASQRRSRLEEVMASVALSSRASTPSPSLSPALTPAAVSPALSPRVSTMGAASGAAAVPTFAAGRPQGGEGMQQDVYSWGGSSTATHTSMSGMQQLGLGSSNYASSSNLTCTSHQGMSGHSSSGNLQLPVAADGQRTPSGIDVPVPSSSQPSPSPGSRSPSSGQPSARSPGSMLLMPWELQHISSPAQQAPPRRSASFGPGPGPTSQPVCSEALTAALTSGPHSSMLTRAALPPSPPPPPATAGSMASGWPSPSLPAVRTSTDSVATAPWSVGSSRRRNSSASGCGTVASCSTFQQDDALIADFEQLDRPRSPSSFCTPLLRHHRPDLWLPAEAAPARGAPGGGGASGGGGGGGGWHGPGEQAQRSSTGGQGQQGTEALPWAAPSAFGSSISGWSATIDTKDLGGSPRVAVLSNVLAGQAKAPAGQQAPAQQAQGGWSMQMAYGGSGNGNGGVVGLEGGKAGGLGVPDVASMVAGSASGSSSSGGAGRGGTVWG